MSTESEVNGQLRGVVGAPQNGPELGVQRPRRTLCFFRGDAAWPHSITCHLCASPQLEH